jgi:hypothetical protein
MTPQFLASWLETTYTYLSRANRIEPGGEILADAGLAYGIDVSLAWVSS